MPRRHALRAAQSATALLLATGCSFAADGPEIVTTIDGDPVYKLLEPDRIPAIREPEFVTGRDADAQMVPSEPVMGLVIDGEAHAYSLWQLDAHEIVWDEFGGVAVAVTW